METKKYFTMQKNIVIFKNNPLKKETKKKTFKMLL